MRTDEVLQSYFDAGYPAVAVETLEEKRLLIECKVLGLGVKTFTIAAAGGLINVTSNTPQVQDAAGNFPKAFEFLSRQRETILFVYDFQYMVSAPASYRPLIRILDICKAAGNMVILVAPIWKLPEELKYMIPVIKSELPTTQELEAPLDAILKAAGNKKLTQTQRTTILSAARGLILEQAESVFALSAKEDFDYRIIENEKMKLVRSDYMSVERPRSEEMLGGLGQLKSYIREEVLPSKDDEQLQVRGLCLIGVPGTGKSLSARVAAALLQWPLVRLDISACKGSLVGQSEANIRKALATADAIAPCVLWLDEIEKAVGGHGSSAHTDGGTTLSMVGTLLTWMQEHTTSVFVVATCNDYAKLPAEMTRAGRFDEKFFLDLPAQKEREAIAHIHLKRLGCDMVLSDAIAAMTEDWTGSEIEQLVKSSARRTGRKITLEMLERCQREIIPISKSQDIKNLRDWAKDNLRRANDADEAPATPRRMARGH